MISTLRCPKKNSIFKEVFLINFPTPTPSPPNKKLGAGYVVFPYPNMPFLWDWGSVFSRLNSDLGLVRFMMVVEPTHLNKYAQNGSFSPFDRGDKITKKSETTT